jgi:hypothetical protein
LATLPESLAENKSHDGEQAQSDVRPLNRRSRRFRVLTTCHAHEVPCPVTESGKMGESERRTRIPSHTLAFSLTHLPIALPTPFFQTTRCRGRRSSPDIPYRTEGRDAAPRRPLAVQARNGRFIKRSIRGPGHRVFRAERGGDGAARHPYLGFVASRGNAHEISGLELGEAR